MEPRAGAPQALSEDRPTDGAPATRSRLGLRVAASCVLLVGLALVQDPGFLVPDTKFDLVADPQGFLERALHLWDAQGFFGQVQNQAYGYLWPMGPFFVLGDLLDVPGWLVQRAWLALVLVVAFTGTARLCRALGVRSDLACLVAGFAFALSPRLLTTLGPISIESWPSALAPWVLLPLVHGSRGGSARRAALLSALAIAMVGGVNASATFAVVPAAAVWLLTRAPGPRRRALVGWWVGGTLLATSWWLVPLFLLGSYSPPFLDFIETTAVTTFPTTPFNVLRGTSNWVPYIDAASRAGNDLVTTPYLALNSAVVVALGLGGLVLRRNPHRSFLVLTLLVGVLMVGAGHSGVVEGWASGDVRALLDGALAPLRNVHKFDPVVRLPLVVGLALLVDRVLRPGAAGGGHVTGPPQVSTRLDRTQQLVVTGLALAVLAGSVTPALLGRVTPAGGTLAVPGYWEDTADWLADNPRAGTTLVLPGSTFADYVWGAPRDEPMQFLSSTPWAVRNVIPLTPPGTIRMLDEVERRLVEGRGSAGLTAYLRRAGVSRLVVRNDLRQSSDVPLPVVVHQALEDSPGLVRTTSFGPDVGGGAELPSDDGRVVVAGGRQALYPAVEVYDVLGGDSTAVASAAPPVVVGGPEDLLDLADLGVLDDEPVELATDAAQRTGDDEAPTGGVVLTDGLRARERFFARIHDGASAVLTPGDVRRTGSPARDYRLDDGDRWSTTARLEGARSVSASSSRSDADAIGGSRRGDLPFAALDADQQDSQWVSAAGQDLLSWWRVDLDEPRRVDTVRLTGGPGAPDNQEVRVRVAGGASDAVDLGPGQTRSVDVPAGETGWVRVEDASGVAGRQLALANVDVAGLVVRRVLETPHLPPSWGDPRAVVLRADLDSRRGCAEVDGDVRCSPGAAVASEEGAGMDRRFTLSSALALSPALRVRPLAGRALDQAVLRGQPVDVAASSVGVPDPRASPVSAIDGDPGTTWLADVDDLRPSLDLTWLGRSTITGLRVGVAAGTPARSPTRLTLTWRAGSREVELVDGVASFEPIRTDRLTLRVEASEDAIDLGFDQQATPVGIGITELGLTGLDYLPLGLSADDVELPCGTGPTVSVDGVARATSVVASPRALAAGSEADARLCEDDVAVDPGLDLGPGPVDVSATGSQAFALSSLVLTEAGEPSPTRPVAGQDTATGPVTRRLDPAPGASTVTMRENTNPGWQARQGDQTLVPLTVDGWQQGWVLADDSTPVDVVLAADRTYRAGLLVGGLAVLALLAALVLVRRRRLGPDHPPSDPRRVPPVLVLTLTVLTGGVVAGWMGVAVATVVVGLVRPLARRGLAAVLVTPYLVVGAWYAVRPWGSATGWAGTAAWTDYLALVPLVAVLAASAWDTGARTRPFSRMAGLSRTR